MAGTSAELPFHAFPPSPPQSSVLRERPDDDVHLHPEGHREDGLPQEDHQETRGPDTEAVQVPGRKFFRNLSGKLKRTINRLPT